MTMKTVQLALDGIQATVLPERGGVLLDLKVNNKSILAKTNWADEIIPYTTSAPDETTWVERWMGGWQLCAPNTGSGQLDSESPAFHGAASQDGWAVQHQTSFSVGLIWESSNKKIKILRNWQITSESSVRVETSATNQSDEVVPIGVAEHLILGSDFLTPLTSGELGSVKFCPAAEIIELDYAGAPIGQVSQTEKADLRWTELSTRRPATVFSLSHPSRKQISVSVGEWVAHVEWDGLDHALVWEEFGFSKEAPWSGQIYALGVEPTNVSHGLGASTSNGPFLEGGQTISWHTSLRFSKVERYPA